MFIYLDHNIIDGISKQHFRLKPSDKIIWIYSDENFAEIKRSNNMKFLEILNDLKAQKIETILDESFKLTGKVNFLPFVKPDKLYEEYIQSINEVHVDNSEHYQFLARLYGADNKDQILGFPDSFKNQIKDILSPYGLYEGEFAEKTNDVADKLEKIVNNEMQEIEELEKTRQSIGTNKGKLNNFANGGNPIEEIWSFLKDKVGPFTKDQFFGFDPIDKQDYTEWPIYLGIVGCHTVLNFLGFNPDKGLNKINDIPSILSDGNHIAHAAYCHGFLSRDKKLCLKAKAIYQYKKIGTLVTKLG